MSRLQQGISKLNSLSNHGGSSISRLSSPSMGGRPAAAARTSTNSSGRSTASWSRSSTSPASSDLSSDTLRRDIRLVVEHLCDTENPLLNRIERERLIDEVLDETFGFGPLEVLLKDPTISDILVNGPHKIYVERRGKLEKTDVKFRDNDHLLQIIDRIVSKVGRRVDETQPDGGRPPAGRLPRQRHHPAAGPRRPDAVDSPLRRQPAEARRPAQLQGVHARDGDAHGGVHQGPAQHRHLAAAPVAVRRRCSTRCRASSRTTSAS